MGLRLVRTSGQTVVALRTKIYTYSCQLSNTKDCLVWSFSVEVVVTEHELRFLDEKWSTELASQTTTEYQSLATKLVTKVSALW